ncbi:MAG: transglycosylase SLT domain-containing protein, partial [Bacteroidales bacterium]|nr:transglycosylase SLT domain-containing protein [Bacteroidales bacterium]
MRQTLRISRIATLAVMALFVVISAVEIAIEPEMPVVEEVHYRDFAEIKESGCLKIALQHNATDYCIFNAQPRGFQLESFEKFAAHHDLQLEIMVTPSDSDAEKLLQEAKCDIIVKRSDYPPDSCSSTPLITTKQIILTNTPDSVDIIYTAKIPLDSTLRVIKLRKIDDEDLAIKIANNEINSAICDSGIAIAYQKAYPQIDIDTSICIPEYISWKTNPYANDLLDSVNSWLMTEKKTKDFRTRQKIFYHYAKIKVSSQYYSRNGNSISVYDDLIQNNSKSINYDWRFIASIIYEESRFNPNISNASGAYGLMQLMPGTYRKFSKKSYISNPDEQIKAGIRYI